MTRPARQQAGRARDRRATAERRPQRGKWGLDNDHHQLPALDGRDEAVEWLARWLADIAMNGLREDDGG